MSFGSDLQQQRERSGVTLEAVAASTKVPPRHLEALEADAWQELPGGVFIRGMVRSYCDVLGLDTTEWLERLETCAPRAAALSDGDWVEFAESVRRSRVAQGAAVGRRWWGVALMLAMVAGMSWAAYRFVVVPRVQPGEMPSLRALVFPPRHT